MLLTLVYPSALPVQAIWQVPSAGLAKECSLAPWYWELHARLYLKVKQYTLTKRK